ncbi:hypothetical protein AKG98_3755 [Moritella sp. JT01]|uniref:hypothetical protein n=1 Tax=Moritella sp. JT01 TaxID=756698 RepID=UPI00079CC15D|nr:hypothetical protein [Moritella sp. JT01]KXO12561.1 hypothetical protein AKG98_3755 [Moritella sp. JT01]
MKFKLLSKYALLIIPSFTIFSSQATESDWHIGNDITFQWTELSDTGSNAEIYANGRMQAKAILKFDVLDKDNNIISEPFSHSQLQEKITIYNWNNKHALNYVNTVGKFTEHEGLSYTFQENGNYVRDKKQHCELSLMENNLNKNSISQNIYFQYGEPNVDRVTHRLCASIHLNGEDYDTCNISSPDPIVLTTVQPTAYSATNVTMKVSTLYSHNWSNGFQRFREVYNWEFFAQNNDDNYPFLYMEKKSNERGTVNLGSKSGQGEILFWRANDVSGAWVGSMKVDFAVLWDPNTSVLVHNDDMNSTALTNIPRGIPVNQKPLGITSFYTNREAGDWCRIGQSNVVNLCEKGQASHLPSIYKFYLYDKYGNKSEPLQLYFHDKTNLQLQNAHLF